MDALTGKANQIGNGRDSLFVTMSTYRLWIPLKKKVASKLLYSKYSYTVLRVTVNTVDTETEKCGVQELRTAPPT